MTFEKITQDRWGHGLPPKSLLPTFDQDNLADLKAVLMGRKVVEVVRDKKGVEFDPDGAGHLLLDDGTVLKIIPNEGCGGCSNGWYTLTALNTVDNVITDVRQVVSDTGRYDEAHTYSIFVFAENEMLNLFTVDGSDGNGYYGTGYSIIVRPPGQHE